MTFFDTHTHLNDPRFQKDLPEVLLRVHKGGVSSALVVGYTVESSLCALDLASGRATPQLELYAAVGVSPHDAKDWRPETACQLVELAAHPSVVAIGEIGLDYHHDLSPRATQRETLVRQLEMAQQLNLPVIIHLRKAQADLSAILSEFAPGVAGVMHCFTGDAAGLEQALAWGFYISLAGVVTFKQADDLRALAAQIPSDRLLLETDSPWLAPVPWRGKICEPWMIRHTAQVVADARSASLEEIATLTSANARKCFRLPNATAAKANY